MSFYVENSSEISILMFDSPILFTVHILILSHKQPTTRSYSLNVLWGWSGTGWSPWMVLGGRGGGGDVNGKGRCAKYFIDVCYKNTHTHHHLPHLMPISILMGTVKVYPENKRIECHPPRNEQPSDRPRE